MSSKNERSKTIASIGGTFDVLHQGHKDYIKMAFASADFVWIYVTAGQCAARVKKYDVRPYKSRVECLKAFLKLSGIKKDSYKIKQIRTENQLIDELVIGDIHKAIVPPEYQYLFDQINQKRSLNGQKKITVVIKKRSIDKNNSDISSTSFRFPDCIKRYIPRATKAKIDKNKIKSSATKKFLHSYNRLAFCKMLSTKN